MNFDLESNTCQANWVKNGTSCYLLVNSNKNFKNAKTDCINRNANLVTFRDQNELDFIRYLDFITFPGSSVTVWV